MDTPLPPAAIIQNENLHIHHKGKGAAAKADVPRPSRAGRQERKALRDLSSKPEKPPLSSSSSSATAAAAATKSAAAKKKKVPPKIKILTEDLTEEELEQCRVWAEEGVERMPYFDQKKHEKEEMEKRVEEEVQKAMSGLRGWTDMTFYGLGVPPKETSSDDEDVLKLEVEPEVLLPKPPSRRTNFLLNSVERIEDLLDLEQIEDLYFEDLYFNKSYELKLKEEYAYSDDGSEDFDRDETTLSLIKPGPFPSNDSSQSSHGEPSLSSNTPHGEPSLSLNSVGSVNREDKLDIKEDKRA